MRMMAVSVSSREAIRPTSLVLRKSGIGKSTWKLYIMYPLKQET
jgi:hypothetical protein